jgi:hypothetical protein
MPSFTSGTDKAGAKINRGLAKNRSKIWNAAFPIWDALLVLLVLTYT